MIRRVLSKARIPSYEGTETIDWSCVSKTWESFRAGYYKFTDADGNDDERVEDAPAEMRAWIASKTLLGDPDADTFEDLVMFPVVNPGTNKLNAGAVRNAISRAPQANISATTAASVQDVGRRLLDKEFSEERESGDWTASARAMLKRIYDALTRFFSLEQRVSLDDIIGDIYAYAWERQAHIHDVQIIDDGIYVMLSEQGRLYRVPVVVDGGQVILGQGEQVRVRSVEPMVTRVWRQSDGQYRWLGISATSVLNRAGEIDSTALIDSFIEHAERTGEYPIRMFYHAGEAYRTGQVDFLARDGYCYVTSGIYDTPLGEIEARARLAEPEYWGDSIGYIPTKSPEFIEAGGVKLPVYIEGINREISTVPVEDACNWFTRANIYEEEKEMSLTGRAKEAFIRLFGGDEAEAEAWLEENTEALNRMIEDDGLIVRADAITEEGTESDKEMPEKDIEVVIDEEIRDSLLETLRADTSEEIDERMAALEARIEALEALVETMQSMLETERQRSGLAYKALVDRVAELEREEEAKLDEMAEDMPRKRQVRVTYRPRDLQRDEEGLPLTADELARQEFQRITGG